MRFHPSIVLTLHWLYIISRSIQFSSRRQLSLMLLCAFSFGPPDVRATTASQSIQGQVQFDNLPTPEILPHIGNTQTLAKIETPNGAYLLMQSADLTRGITSRDLYIVAERRSAVGEQRKIIYNGLSDPEIGGCPSAARRAELGKINSSISKLASFYKHHNLLPGDVNGDLYEDLIISVTEDDCNAGQIYKIYLLVSDPNGIAIHKFRE